MSKRRSWLALTGPIFLLGASPQASADRSQCTPGYCVNITIDAEKGVINPVPDIVVKKGMKDVHIHWRLPEGQNRHSFRQDHIKLKKTEDHNDNAFDDEGPKDQRTYHWHNKNPKAKEYLYEINVFDATTGKVIHLDPKIINQG
jgi:hypothetical protein